MSSAGSVLGVLVFVIAKPEVGSQAKRGNEDGNTDYRAHSAPYPGSHDPGEKQRSPFAHSIIRSARPS